MNLINGRFFTINHETCQKVFFNDENICIFQVINFLQNKFTLLRLFAVVIYCISHANGQTKFGLISMIESDLKEQILPLELDQLSPVQFLH